MAHMNMYQQNEKVIDLDFPKTLVIMITVLLFFVLPAQLITVHQKDPQAFSHINALVEDALNINQVDNVSASDQPEGNVAGASTTISLFDGSSETSNSLRSKSPYFLGLGMFFLVISILGIAYLMNTEKDYKQI